MMDLLWVTLHVGDLEKSTAFYTQLLGMEVSSRFGGAGHQIVMLGRADGAKVELIGDGDHGPASPGAGVSFGLETEDMQALTDKLTQAGHTVQGPVSPHPHVRFSFVRDPDGYTVQLVERS